MPPSARSVQPAKALFALRDVQQSQAARDLGVSAHYLGRVLNGRERPSDEFRHRLARYLNTDSDDLFADDPTDVIVAFVRRTTESSGVPERVDDVAAVEQTAAILRNVG